MIAPCRRRTNRRSLSLCELACSTPRTPPDEGRKPGEAHAEKSRPGVPGPGPRVVLRERHHLGGLEAVTRRIDILVVGAPPSAGEIVRTTRSGVADSPRAGAQIV